MQNLTETATAQLSTSTPKVELELGDGSRLVFDDANGSPVLCRLDGEQAGRVTLADAMQLSGQPFAGYRHLRG